MAITDRHTAQARVHRILAFRTVVLANQQPRQGGEHERLVE